MNTLLVQPDHKDLLVVDHLDYRGYSVDFYEDPYGKQLYSFFENNQIDFGTDNTQYKDDYKKLIDDHLDTITRFDQFQNYTGVRLTWFDNGGFKDIKLIHWNRILKVWLISDPEKVDLDNLIQEALRILSIVIKNDIE